MTAETMTGTHGATPASSADTQHTRHPPLASNPLASRRAGILLHPTSLPGNRDQGDLGAEAFRFVDFLRECCFSVWQTLPLGPTHTDGSPYQCLSVHAGNVDLISLDDLVARGWLDSTGNNLPASLVLARCGFESRADKAERRAYREFKRQHASWLNDYALYLAIRHTQGNASWFDWPAPLRNRTRTALLAFRKAHADELEQIRFEQFVFFTQWHALREYARRNGISLFGDIPIFVAHDSADVWAHRKLFTIDKAGRAKVVAGVPPDYFSATGQRWGNPLYHWDRMAADDFRWWVERFRSQLDLFDIIRLDHFRGFEKYWEIPAESETAIDGKWIEGPGAALFTRLEKEFGTLPIVAEDLGTITPEVDALRDQFDMPGMKILQFAFDSGPENPYLPENHGINSVVYTGTHDNDTTLGWFESLDDAHKAEVYRYLGHTEEAMPWALMRAALESRARLAILPMQDVLALGSEHRMNTPGTSADNWHWRFNWSQVGPELAARMHALIDQHQRCQVAST